jgi:uncharacterized glyoxalase superfamily protein PhnB/uncharacterized protein YndB with AHSA1/START domain
MKRMKEAIATDVFSGKTDDREIIINRLLDAPRELVFEVWTNPKHLVNWWGCKNFSSTFQQIEIKPGGKWHFVMNGPDGTSFANFVLFTEVVKPERLAYLHAASETEEPNFKVTVTFEERGQKTWLTMRSIYATTAERDHAVSEIGVIKGSNETIDKLELYIKSKFELQKQFKTKNMSRVSTYLNFKNETEQAFRFYRSVFETEFHGDGITTFASAPPHEGMPPLSEEDKKLVLHVELPILGGHVLMGTDAPESFGFNLNFGDNIHINLEPDSREETKKLFDALSAGGTVTMDLQDMFWGGYYGSCRDKFGVNWMFNFTE